MPISQAATVCVFDLADCACYARASDKLDVHMLYNSKIDACRFADFHHISCSCCGVRVYTAIVEHGKACCDDDIRRAAGLVTLRVVSVARVYSGDAWLHMAPSFVACWVRILRRRPSQCGCGYSIHRVDGY